MVFPSRPSSEIGAGGNFKPLIFGVVLSGILLVKAWSLTDETEPPGRERESLPPWVVGI